MARLDRLHVLHQLDRFGLRQGQLASLAGVSELTLSRAMTGHSVSRDTVHRIAAALLELQPAPGIDLVLAQPGGQA